MYVIRNVSVHQKIVCTLKDGSTLRLLPKQEKNLKDTQVTDHLVNLSKNKNRLVILTYIPEDKQEEKTIKKTTNQKISENKNKKED